MSKSFWLFGRLQKIIIVLFLLVTGSQQLISPVLAQDIKQFSSSYDVTYDVDSSGVTTVTENIKLRNLTDKYFASNFSLTIDSTQVTDVFASDSQGNLEAKVSKVDNTTKIDVSFSQQIVGKNKEYDWKLVFKSKDFAEKSGKVWQVTVPRISSASDIDNYTLVLKVPVEFGDPTTITPEPKGIAEIAGKLALKFEKDQLVETGILANFGDTQVFDFKLTYHLSNPSVFPALTKLSLPSDNSHQQVIIKDIQPRPENVAIDSDGNYVGYFNINRKSDLIVFVTGKAKLNLKKPVNTEALTKDQALIYTQPQRYWEVDNPVIKSRLNEIFKGSNAKTNSQKAKLINDFAVNFLQYNEQRIGKTDFQRLGAVTALSNPTSALCSEFTDLFITLARAAGIPARQLIGYAYSSNEELRPLSLKTSVLHSWPEYYDSNLGWVMIDPTWQNTTGGVDYFNHFDLNHLILATHGTSSEVPNTADEVSVGFGTDEFLPNPFVELAIDSPNTLFAGFPATSKIMISNYSGVLIPETKANFRSSRVDVVGQKEFVVLALPPYSKVSYVYDLRTRSIFEGFKDNLILNFGKQSISKEIEVKPFFSYQYFSVVVMGLFVIMVGFYGFTLGFHFRKSGKMGKKKK